MCSGVIRCFHILLYEILVADGHGIYNTEMLLYAVVAYYILCAVDEFVASNQRIDYSSIEMFFSSYSVVDETLVADIYGVLGGALNRGLLFADPPPSLLGAVSGNISEIR
jgi:hypothetical protein